MSLNIYQKIHTYLLCYHNWCIDCTARTKLGLILMSELLVLLVLVRRLRDNADQVEILLGFVSKEAVEITNKSVHISFACKMKMLNIFLT